MAKNTKDKCFDDLKQRILSTDLEPGSDLDEVRLSEYYGMSRTPLREVFQRLAGEGYLDRTAHRGAKVAPMDLNTLRVFFQTAPMIYANISRMAAENRTDRQIQDLQAAQDVFAEAVDRGDTSASALANHQFHYRIGLMAQNSYLMACLERLLIDHTRLSQTFYRPNTQDQQDRIQSAVRHHVDLIEAFQNRDAEGAVAITLEHWDLSRNRMEQFVRPDPLPIEYTGETL